MYFSKISANLILCIILFINFNLCNTATLPANENNTIETTALAKTSDAIVDVFEDIRWFFGRLGIFCELVEQMLPPEKRDGDKTQLSLNLESGFRHFLLGVREISKSIVAVLSNKEVQEYQQLSRATDYAQEAVKSVGDFFRNLRLLVGKLFETYNYYVPEVILSKCIGNYLHETYAHRPMYEYPILMINDIIEAFKTPINQQIEGNTFSRKIGSGTDINFVKNVEQNEILDDDMYMFHNTPVSPTPELAVRFDNETPDQENLSNKGEQLAVMNNQELSSKLSWKKCFKVYATETIFRKLEFYFLERRE